MQNSSLLSLFMPVAIGIVMLGLGLSLTINDFRRVAQYPKAIAVALVCQMLILPTVCWSIAVFFELPPVLAVGLMLLSASPGGPAANLYSHLSDGDVALNLTLTAVNSLLTLFTLPLIVNLSLDYFLTSDQHIQMQFRKVIEVFAIVLVPVSVGMVVRAKTPQWAARADKPFKAAAALFLVLVIVLACFQERDRALGYIKDVGVAGITFNLLSLAVGYLVPQWFGVGRKQAIAVAMEIGIHNASLAIYIALNILNDSQMAIPAALYGIVMFFTAGLFGYWVKQKQHALALAKNEGRK
jgi:bile acid:Na+ symporter, BASS family